MSEEKMQKKRGGCFKWIIIILLVIIAFSACVAALGGGEDETSTDNSSDESTSTASEETEETAETETTEESTEEVVEEESPDAGIGESLDVGKMSYTVNEVTTASQVGPSAFPTTANETYVVIDVTVTNNGDEAVTVDSTYFKMIIDGATFDADSAASMSANQNENGEITNSFFLENLNPGSTLSGKIVFDVSQANADNPEKVLQVQEGMFGSNTGTINLQ